MVKHSEVSNVERLKTADGQEVEEKAPIEQNSVPAPEFVNGKELLDILNAHLEYMSCSLLSDLQAVVSDAIKNEINKEIPVPTMKLAFENAIRIINSESKMQTEEMISGNDYSISVTRLFSDLIDIVLYFDRLSEVFEKLSTDSVKFDHNLFRLPMRHVAEIFRGFVNLCL